MGQWKKSSSLSTGSVQPYTYKIFIARNHDHSLKPGHFYKSALRRWDLRIAEANYQMARTPEEPQQLIQDRMASRKSDIINLHPGDPSATITIREQDCLIFGLPHTSIYFGPNTFMIDRDSEDPWLKAPEKADILISHSPPMGFHDKNLNGKHQGCGRLKGAILRIKPRLVVCGSCARGSRDYNNFLGRGWINGGCECCGCGSIKEYCLGGSNCHDLVILPIAINRKAVEESFLHTLLSHMKFESGRVVQAWTQRIWGTHRFLPFLQHIQGYLELEISELVSKYIT